jgi:hypothetical protein
VFTGDDDVSVFLLTAAHDERVMRANKKIALSGRKRSQRPEFELFRLLERARERIRMFDWLDWIDCIDSTQLIDIVLWESFVVPAHLLGLSHSI